MARSDSFTSRAKAALQKVSDTLNPEKQFGPAAKRQMEAGRKQYGGSRDRTVNDAVERATGDRRDRSDGGSLKRGNKSDGSNVKKPAQKKKKSTQPMYRG